MVASFPISLPTNDYREGTATPTGIRGGGVSDASQSGVCDKDVYKKKSMLETTDDGTWVTARHPVVIVRAERILSDARPSPFSRAADIFDIVVVR